MAGPPGGTTQPAGVAVAPAPAAACRTAAWSRLGRGRRLASPLPGQGA